MLCARLATYSVNMTDSHKTENDEQGRVNDQAMAEANRTVLARSIYTDPSDNLRTLDRALLWELMKATDPETFQRCLVAAVEFVTPEPM